MFTQKSLADKLGIAGKNRKPDLKEKIFGIKPDKVEAEKPAPKLKVGGAVKSKKKN